MSPNHHHHHHRDPEEDGQQQQQERIFQRHWHRLQVLKRWLELAVRPARRDDDCPPQDWDLLEREEDDCLDELQRRIRQARRELNANLPVYCAGKYEAALVAKPSTIPGAGLGLFYEPATATTSVATSTAGTDNSEQDANCGGTNDLSDETKPRSDDDDDDDDEGGCSIPAGALLCYYYGHLHDFHSAQRLPDRSYLLLVRDDVLVDPGPLPHVCARYVNDPLNDDLVNCKYVPERYRSAVVATRAIRPGDELFASYGDGYWSQHDGAPPGRAKV